MTVPANFLQQVQTYQMAQLAFLGNYGAFIHESNKKFQNFENLTANLGDTVTYELTPRFVSQQGLVVNYQPTQQRVQTLICDQGFNTSYSYTNQQFIFNVEDYMMRVGKAAIHELATEVESNVAQLAETAPYRFYGNGINQIDSFGQLAQMLAFFRNYGAPKDTLKVFISDMVEPLIVNTGLNQFTLDRNNELANSWEVGAWNGVEYFRSNLLPIHYAGTVGNTPNLELTVVSTNDPTGNNITQITVSGAAVSDANAIKKYDSLQLVDNVSGFPNMRYLTFIGHKPSSNPVQLQVTADAASDSSGNIVLNISPALCATVGNANQNIQFNVVAGMKISVLPDHRCGLVVSGNAMMLAMPKLPDQRPYDTATSTDPETGASLRLTYGAVLGQNQLCWVNDVIWGTSLAGEYCMKMVTPV